MIEKVADPGKLDAYSDQKATEDFRPVDPASGEPVASTDVDSDTGQKFTGTHMEPNENIDPKDGKPSEVLGSIDSEAPESADGPKTVKDESPPKPGNYGRSQRDQIYKNADAIRDDQLKNEDAPASNFIQLLEQEAAGGAPQVAQQPVEGVDAETQDTAKLIQEQQEGVDPATADPTKVVDTAPKYFYIKVDGAEQIVSDTQIRDAGGVEALQKSRSADLRFQDLATERRRLDQREADLNAQIPVLVRKEASKYLNQANTPANVPDKDRTGTTGDEAGVKAVDVAQKIFEGNSEDGGVGLDQLIDQRLAKQSTSDSTVVSGDAREDELVTEVVKGLDPGQQPTSVRSQEQVRANQVYSDKFPNLVVASESRPEILQHAVREMDRRKNDPVNTGRTLPELALEVGDYLTTLYLPPQGVSLQDVLSLDDAQSVVVSKRRLRATTTDAAPSVHTTDARQDQPLQYGQQHQSAFQKLKAARGQK